MRFRPVLIRLPTALALLMSLILAGCSASSAARPPASHQNRLAGTLRLPLYDHTITMDPARADTPSDLFLASLLYSGLVKFGPDLHIIPDLAVSIPTISDDGRTYTFTVRQDARFADGRHCTAADVAYSLSRALSPPARSSLARHYLHDIQGAGAVERGATDSLSGVHVTDKLTLRIRLVHPDAAFLEKLAFPVASVVDRHALDSNKGSGWMERPDGTGPWALSQRLHDGALELRPRLHYYGGSLQLKRLLLVPVHSLSSALELYRTGELDVAQVPLGGYASLSTRDDFHSSPSLDAYYALPNPAASGEVLAAHLDRASLIESATPALSPLDAVVPPALPDYVPSPPIPDPGTVVSAPRVRLAPVTPWDSTAQLLRRALRRQWPDAKDGATARLVHLTSYLPDPAVWLRIVLRQTRSHWYRSLLSHASRLTNDPVSRMSAYSRGENWALKRGLVIPLASGNIGFLIKRRVQSLQVTPMGVMPENNNWASASAG